MPKTAAKLKEDLMSRGVWPDFVRYRQELKVGGKTSMEAHKQAIEKFIAAEDLPAVPDEATRTNYGESGKKTPKHKAKAMGSARVSPPSTTTGGSPGVTGEGLDVPRETAVAPPPSPSFTPDEKAAMSERVKQRKAKKEERDSVTPGVLPPLPPISADTFNGKVASELDAARWVGANMEVTDPSIEECPSAAAWAWLSQCRSSIISKADFWKITVPKLLPSKAQMDSGQDPDAVDEGKAVEVIDRLLKFSDVKEESDGES